MKTFNTEHLFPLNDEVSILINHPQLFTILYPSFKLKLETILKENNVSFDDWILGVLDNGGIVLMPDAEVDMSKIIALNNLAWKRLALSIKHNLVYSEYCEQMSLKLSIN